jgi:hypothetical protein
VKARYTSIVTWQRRAIGAIALVLLTLTPAAATTCAIVCHGDHDAAAHCQESAEPTGVALHAAPDHGCGSHETALGEEATPPQLRVSGPPVRDGLTAALDRVHGHAGRDARLAWSVTLASSSPPGTDPATTTPSVLRI